MRKLILPALIAVLIVSSALTDRAARAQTSNAVLALTSPDGNLKVSFALKSLPAPYAAGSRPYYNISFQGLEIIADSPLGLQFDGAPSLDRGLSVIGRSTRSEDSSWEDALNDNRTVRDQYNELTIHLKEGPKSSAGG